MTNPHSSADSRLAPHFGSMETQVRAGKLGMWLFLATEIMLFGGLFCIYAIFRAIHPEAFDYGHFYLDRTWGLLNTLVLIVSSFTMAMAVRAAQCGSRRDLILYLSMTLLLAVDFLGVKTIEYSHKFHDRLLWSRAFYAVPPVEAIASAPETAPVVEAAPPAPALAPGDPRKGREVFLGTCASCHGQVGQGMPGLGRDIRDSEFIQTKSEAELVKFLQVGRMPGDPLNTTGKMMPARGGNPAITDQDLADIASWMKEFQTGTADAAATEGSAEKPRRRRTAQVAEASEPEEIFIMEKSFIAPAPAGPAGLLPAVLTGAVEAAARHEVPVDPRTDPDRPLHLHTFFSIYFLMTGLHGIHVLIGMVVIVWLLLRAARGEFGSSYFAPVDLGGLYWHLVDVIWIFLFPLLYLIR